MKGNYQLAQLWAHMAAVTVVRRRHNKRHHREQIFSAHINIFGMTEEKITDTYRLPNNTFLELLDELRDDLEPVTKRNHLTPYCLWQKLVATFCFLASGSFQRVIASLLVLASPRAVAVSSLKG